MSSILGGCGLLLPEFLSNLVAKDGPSVHSPPQYGRLFRSLHVSGMPSGHRLLPSRKRGVATLSSLDSQFGGNRSQASTNPSHSALTGRAAGLANKDAFQTDLITADGKWEDSPQGHEASNVAVPGGSHTQVLQMPPSAEREALQLPEETLLAGPSTDVGQIIESIADVDRQNRELMNQIAQFTKMLKETMQQVTLTAQSARNEGDRQRRMAQWRESAQATGAALEQILAEGAEVKRAVAEWKAREMRLAEERRLEELKREERRVQHAIDAATARLAEATARLQAVEADERAALDMAAVLTGGNAAASHAQARGGSDPVMEVREEALSSSPGASEQDAEDRLRKVQWEENWQEETAAARGHDWGAADLASSTDSESSLAEDDDDAPLGPDAVTLPASLQCVMAHPGALSCTSTTFRKDDVRRTAVVTMETTVRCSGDACSTAGVDGDDYIALGLQALSAAATELRRSQFQRFTDSDPSVHQKHQAILEVLERGDLVKCSPIDPPSKFGHVSFVAKMVNKETGYEIGSLVKPRVEGDADGWHRAPIEWVAYELNNLLGMDYVPPVAYRRGGIDVNWNHFEEGAFIYWVPGCRQLSTVSAANWGVSVAHLLSDTRILDVLLNNSDRHHGHFFLGQHWTDGKMRPVLIDHAAGFRKEAVVTMEHENAFETGPVRCVAASTYLRLRFLDRQIVTEKFKDVLTEEEIDGMMKRKDMILAYLDSLVKERGYHRTVIE